MRVQLGREGEELLERHVAYRQHIGRQGQRVRLGSHLCRWCRGRRRKEECEGGKKVSVTRHSQPHARLLLSVTASASHTPAYSALFGFH